MQTQKFSVKGRLNSFRYAFAGIRSFFRYEHNAWIHGIAAVLVIILSFVVGLSRLEMIAVLFSIAFVWMAEMINTAIEKAMDHLSPGRHPHVKAIKDMAAGAVLIAAIAALITGLIIFLPKLI